MLTQVAQSQRSKLYLRLFQDLDDVTCVSKPEAAGTIKLYERCQRIMCVTYPNEMADAGAAHDIDQFKVCSAATTSPFGTYRSHQASAIHPPLT